LLRLAADVAHKLLQRSVGLHRIVEAQAEEKIELAPLIHRCFSVSTGRLGVNADCYLFGRHSSNYVQEFRVGILINSDRLSLEWQVIATLGNGAAPATI
jgi:hypothetical protein